MQKEKMQSRSLRDCISIKNQVFRLSKLWMIQAMPEISANRIIPPMALLNSAPKNIPPMLAATIMMTETTVLNM
ncbi:hypothetical protein BACCAP_01254 [Pseudoflavonifractor capillosus ATCC 29799]|uniref:Uncharacterized protein n=1 Tax=Pseudoflavonifractor capillosus ATCC 29799 TaxID=411467 RepID=A6NSS4_9FIRM|nr:hypothetical protein BACCAP_01254 [Pseudoflavonifractor capillosus ATCC 29799]